MPNERTAGARAASAGSLVPVAGGARGERDARRRLHAAGARSSASRAAGATRSSTRPSPCRSASRCRSSASRGSWRSGVASLLPGRRARVAQLGLAVVAGLVGLSLLVVQLRLGKLLPVLLRRRRERHRRARSPPRRAFGSRRGAGSARSSRTRSARDARRRASRVPLVGGFHASTVAAGHPATRSRETPRGRGHGRRLRRLRVPLLPHDERRARAAPRGRTAGACASSAGRCR